MGRVPTHEGKEEAEWHVRQGRRNHDGERSGRAERGKERAARQEEEVRWVAPWWVLSDETEKEAPTGRSTPAPSAPRAGNRSSALAGPGAHRTAHAAAASRPAAHADPEASDVSVRSEADVKGRKNTGKVAKDTGKHGRDYSYEGDKGLGQEAAAVRKPMHYGIFGAGLPATKVKPPRRIRRR